MSVSVQSRSKVKTETHLTHHQGAVLGAVCIRVLVGVVVLSRCAEGLVGALTRSGPEKQIFIIF